MSQPHPLACVDCEREFDAEDGERLSDDEFRCHDCADESRELYKQDRKDERLDDPRRW